MADGEGPVAAEHDDVVLLEPLGQQVGDLLGPGRELGVHDRHLVQQVGALAVDGDDLVAHERAGDRVGRVRVHDGLRGGALVDRPVHVDLGAGQHDVGVVLLEARLDDVALLETGQHGAAPGDQDAVAHADAQVAAVGADDAGDEEVPADLLELLEDGRAHGAAVPAGAAAPAASAGSARRTTPGVTPAAAAVSSSPRRSSLGAEGTPPSSQPREM